MSINFKHSQTGILKECPEGFSWTYFFFGAFVAAFRGMWTQFFVSVLTFHLASLYYMFVINKIYATALMEKGYVPASSIDHNKLTLQGLLAPKAG